MNKPYVFGECLLRSMKTLMGESLRRFHQQSKPDDDILGQADEPDFCTHPMDGKGPIKKSRRQQSSVRTRKGKEKKQRPKRQTSLSLAGIGAAAGEAQKLSTFANLFGQSRKDSFSIELVSKKELRNLRNFRDLFKTMHAKPWRKFATENGDVGDEGIIAASFKDGDLVPIVRHAFEAGKAEFLLHQLENVAKKKEIEIEELCKLHYEDFIVAVEELRGVLVDADELKNTLSGENYRLQEIGCSLLLKLDEILELYAVKKNVMEAIRIAKACALVTNLCVKCNKHVSEGQFYPALKTLELIERDYLQKVPVKALQKVIEKQIPAIKKHIEKQVSSEFNDWLVQIRSAAKEIGQLALRQAASARQRDEEIRAQQRVAEEQSRSGSRNFVYDLDTEKTDEDLVLEFDLSPVYRAHNIHACLGMQDQFRDYYHKNRLMQLNLDLQISSSMAFFESHQTFLAQIAGFFIVEDRVLRTADGLLSFSQVERAWDTAIAKIATVLEESFSYMDSTSQLLLIKDNVTLLCATLKRHGYQVAPLLEVLDNSRDKYHNLLLDDCRKQITDAIANDTYEQVTIRKEYEYDKYILSCNLQTSDQMPVLPYVAPFSSTVPDACRIVRSFIADSISYLSYGGRLNLFDVVRKYLDKLLIYALSESLLKAIHNSTTGVSQAMQIAANISILEHACDLFLHHAAQLCGIPIYAAERLHASLSAKVVLKTSQDAAYHALLSLVNLKLDEVISLAENINCAADEIPQNGNVYLGELVAYLEAVMSTAHQILPLDAVYKVGSGALEHISSAIVAAFLSDSVKKFTMNAVVGIDNDLKQLESFAEEQFHGTGLFEIHKGGSFQNCLTEARQLMNLLLSNQPESFLNPVIREKRYNALDDKKVASILEKFKDAPDRLFGSLSSRNTKQNSRKKSMDVLKRRLREFN
ncbi:Exocyst complex component S15A [Asimina triloba]